MWGNSWLEVFEVHIDRQWRPSGLLRPFRSLATTALALVSLCFLLSAVVPVTEAHQHLVESGIRRYPSQNVLVEKSESKVGKPLSSHQLDGLSPIIMEKTFNGLLGTAEEEDEPAGIYGAVGVEEPVKAHFSRNNKNQAGETEADWLKGADNFLNLEGRPRIDEEDGSRLYNNESPPQASSSLDITNRPTSVITLKVKKGFGALNRFFPYLQHQSALMKPPGLQARSMSQEDPVDPAGSMQSRRSNLRLFRPRLRWG